jgi:suppressor of G2 allele of SKP1
MMSTSTLRYDWYQSDEKVIINVMVKNAQKEDVSVDIEPDSVTVSVKIDANSEQQISLPLANEILPQESTFEILKTKIEVSLRKKAFKRWDSLEHKDGAEPVLGYPSSSKKVLIIYW